MISILSILFHSNEGVRKEINTWFLVRNKLNDNSSQIFMKVYWVKTGP